MRADRAGRYNIWPLNNYIHTYMHTQIYIRQELLNCRLENACRQSWQKKCSTSRPWEIRCVHMLYHMNVYVCGRAEQARMHSTTRPPDAEKLGVCMYVCIYAHVICKCTKHEWERDHLASTNWAMRYVCVMCAYFTSYITCIHRLSDALCARYVCMFLHLIIRAYTNWVMRYVCIFYILYYVHTQTEW